MKVSDTGNTAGEIIHLYKAQSQKAAEGEKPAGDAASVPEEKVSLSAQARDVQTIKKAINELPDVRKEKVDALKKQIREGSYDVNGEKIAQKMIGESLLDIIVW
jgi:negative regulator of flagellin synthesis FlgM